MGTLTHSSMRDTDKRLDEAARAGWLYYVAGRRQDEIADIMGISRQSAQRLVSLAVSAGLVKVRIDHPIAELMELGREIKAKYDLEFIDVVPSDPHSDSTTLGIAEAGALEIERRFLNPEPQIFAIGTGRTLKAAIDLMPQLDCPQHQVVSLAGNISPDGSASFYNVIFAVADTTKARSFPMPLPVIASTSEEREALQKQPLVSATLEMAHKANAAFVGVGDLGPKAPLCIDGYVPQNELEELCAAGGVGEICGWAFNAEGKLLDGMTNDRVASGPLPSTKTCTVIALAKGERKLPGIRAALKGRLVNGLITDEATAAALLQG